MGIFCWRFRLVSLEIAYFTYQWSKFQSVINGYGIKKAKKNQRNIKGQKPKVKRQRLFKVRRLSKSSLILHLSYWACNYLIIKIKDIKSIYTNRALAYIKLKKYKRAIKDCTNVIEYM